MPRENSLKRIFYFTSGLFCITSYLSFRYYKEVKSKRKIVNELSKKKSFTPDNLK